LEEEKNSISNGKTEGSGRNKRKLGSIWEKYAVARLREAGLKIITLNFRCRLGEIDIVARDGDYLVFTEVKCRKSRAAGNPLEAVNAFKQRTIRKVAAFFLLRYGLKQDTPCRFDVYGIEADARGRVLREYWVRDAF